MKVALDALTGSELECTLAEPEMEETPAVVDPATTEGDENQDAEAAKADAGVVEEPEGTKDIQTMAKEPISEAPSTEAQVKGGRGNA